VAHPRLHRNFPRYYAAVARAFGVRAQLYFSGQFQCSLALGSKQQLGAFLLEWLEATTEMRANKEANDNSNVFFWLLEDCFQFLHINKTSPQWPAVLMLKRIDARKVAM
jgi:hypothetical protein